MLQTLTEIIKQDYEKWKDGQVVFITAPTGSGKTHFCLHTLFPYAIEQGQRILYLVNRKILKEQIQKEVNDVISMKPEWYYRGQQYLVLKTYQQIEEAVKNNYLGDELNGFRWIICDEAHYFMADSLFNTGTIFSFKEVVKHIGKATIIFMSATLDQEIEFITDEARTVFVDIKRDQVKNNFPDRHWLTNTFKNPLTYTIQSDYSYIKPDFIEHLEEIPKRVKASGKKKWLIFFNNIETGNELKRYFKDTFEKETVFISSKYGDDFEARDAVGQIVNKKFSDYKIIIATSALDNGVSIHDRNLRNLIILADSKEQLIQMLGRKRRDDEPVHLYLYAGDKKVFNGRLQYYKEVQQYIQKFYSICQSCNPNVSAFVPMLYDLRAAVKYVEELLKDQAASEAAHRFLSILNYRNDFGGHFSVNPFSIYEISNRIKFYKRIIEEMTIDELAFKREQLSWLGFSEDILLQTIEDQKVRIKEQLAEKLNEFLRGEDSEADINQDELRKAMKPAIDDWARLCPEFKKNLKNKINYIGQDDRPITSDTFNSLIQAIGLPYQMDKLAPGKYGINKLN